jgi:hypothetical protein
MTLSIGTTLGIEKTEMQRIDILMMITNDPRTPIIGLCSLDVNMSILVRH